MNITPELITTIGTAIVGPILAYLKISTDRKKTGNKRDTQIALLEQRVKECEKNGDTIDELKQAINKIEVSLAKIESLIELFIKGKHLE